jgi:putative ABC transport system permease protein
MWNLALATIRQRTAGFVGVFIAVLAASALVTALGVLFESGLRSGVPPQRYAAASVIVGGNQAFPLEEDIDPHYSERVPLPANTVDTVSHVSGVDKAVPDLSVETSINGAPAVGHGWSSAALAPFGIKEGHPPAAPGEIVLDADLAQRNHVKPGDRLEIAFGGTPATYTLAGIATPPGADRLGRQSVLFFTDDEAKRLSGRPDQVDTVGVLGKPGVDPDELAARIRNALPGMDIVTYTGKDRGDVEFLDVGAARSDLLVLSSTFAGTATMIAMLVVASTLALSIQQRRREIALLRAIAASRRQVHRMIGTEILLVAGIAAALGALPGIALAYLLKAGFAKGGVLPADFGLALSPLPALVAIVLCVGTARIAGWVAARRPAKISPVEALGESAVEPKRLPKFRIIAGWAAMLLGVGASGLLLVIPGEAAVAGVAGSALMLVLSIALLGPRLVSGAVRLVGAPLRRFAPVGGYLAVANTHAAARRLATAVTPLALAVAMASVQIFSQTTESAAAADQARDGLLADLVVTGAASGLDPRLTDEIRLSHGVTVASPIIRSQVFVPFLETGKPQVRPYAAQGLQPDGLNQVLNLDLRHGDMSQLRGQTVALSQMAAETIGVETGSTLEIRLGDGAKITPKVVAIYGRGLGFGDVTLPHDLLAAHTTTRLDQSVLVRTTDPAATTRDLAKLQGIVVHDRTGLAAAGQAERDAQNWPSLIALVVLLAYIAIAVVNTLVMATASRTREFALLRLIGSARRQVVHMMRIESLIVIAVAAIVGTLAAIPPLIGFSIGLTESWRPSIPPTVYLGILGITAALGLLAIGLPTRFALRARPVDAISIRD